MSDDLIPTWVYDSKGESQLVHLAKGAPAPKGWAFEPPSGIAVVVEGNAASSPPTPLAVQGSVDARFADLHDRLSMVEFKLEGVMAKLDAMTVPEEPAQAVSSERPALVARAKELKLEFHNRLGDAKLKALIEEAEAAQKPVEGE